MQKITPCLWFDNNAEQAVKFYTSVFKNSKIKNISRYGDEGAKVSGMQKGSVMTITFQLEGHEFMALNGGPVFTFSQATSFFVSCKTEEEISGLFKKLSKGGSAVFALGKYPWAEKYGWCKDKYGVSWQLILAQRKQKITPAFLFVKEQAGKAEEAMKFYTSIFKNSKIESIARDDDTKTVLHAVFTLSGQNFIAMESNMKHDFTFSPAISFVVNCRTQKDLDYYWKKLSKGGDEKAQQCGWLADKYGLSWQIVPNVLEKMLRDKDAKKSERVMKALIHMKKLDIKTLEQAYKEK